MPVKEIKNIDTSKSNCGLCDLYMLRCLTSHSKIVLIFWCMEYVSSHGMVYLDGLRNSGNNDRYR